MSPDQLLDAIESESLAIRRIPLIVSSLYSLRSHKEGNEIILSPMQVSPGQYAKRKSWFLNRTGDAESYLFDDEAETIHRKFTKVDRVPEHAGYWMCQPCRGTGSTMLWSIKDHHLAPTLAESVTLYLNSFNPQR